MGLTDDFYEKQIEALQKQISSQEETIKQQRGALDIYEKLVQAQDESIAYLKSFIAKLGYGKVG